MSREEYRKSKEPTAEPQGTLTTEIREENVELSKENEKE